jgi:hypothetical protein
LVAELRCGRTHGPVCVVTVRGIRHISVGPKTRLLLEVAISKAILVEVEVPSDELGIVVDDPIAVVVDAIALLGRVGMHVRVGIITVLGNLRKPGAFTPSTQLGRVSKTVAIDVPIERRRLRAAFAVDGDTCVVDEHASRWARPRITASHHKTQEGHEHPSHLTSNFHN